jgi:hypothetical protein
VDWLSGIGWLGRLGSGSLYGPLPMLLMAPMVVLLLVTRFRDGAAMSSSSRDIVLRQPGWLARRRAQRGIAHRPKQIGIGYPSVVTAVRIDIEALRLAGYVGGAPGSGKTSFLRTLIQGFPGPVVVLDLKGSPDLADTVWSLPGHVWEIGGPLKLDLLDPEPAILAQQLLEGEIFTDRGTVYRAIAEHACLQAAHVLRWRGLARDPAHILELISSPAVLAEAIRAAAPGDSRMAPRWIRELEDSSPTVREAFGTFAHRLGMLLDSPAGLSLGAGADAITLSDVVATQGKLLMRLDPRYGAISRKLGAWMLVAMLRLAAELRAARWDGQLLFIVDEPRLLGHEGRHLADLFGTARDAGVGLVVADQGIAGLSGVHPDLPDAVVRSTGWQLVLRQGSATDAEKMAALFGMTQRADVAHSSDGRTTTRWHDEPRVKPHWLLGLPPGAAWLRVAPTGDYRRETIERLQVARPQPTVHVRRLALPPGEPVPRGTGGTPGGTEGGTPATAASELEVDNDGSNPGASGQAVRRDTPGHPEPDFSSVDGQKRTVYRRVKVIDGWRRWRGLFDHDGWPQMWGQRPYKSIYEWEQGPIPPRWTIDHTCGEKDCLDHLQAVTLGENLRRRHARERGELPVGHAGMSPPGQPEPAEPGDGTEQPDGTDRQWQSLTVEERRAEVQRLRGESWSVRRIAEELGVGRSTVGRYANSTSATMAVADGPEPVAAATEFAIALFAHIGRPVFERRAVDLANLVKLLTTFRQVADKKQARCWSPTRYADDVTSRGNAGVEAVSALVFDLDRVPPDPKRLEGVCWIGHTTWSHQPDSPRWRVVIPLAQPVPATSWSNVWQRARAALSPEADPACKDPSRAYWLPSRPAGVAPETGYHPGPLLDSRTLPELAREQKGLRPSARSTPKVSGDHGRAEAYMTQVLDNLATVASGGRNAALNRAAWTLGRWVAAGELEQATVEDGLYAAADQNGLVADDGERQTWATIRSGLSAGLQQAFDLDDGR